MATDDLAQWQHVDDEEERSKNGAPRNTLVDRCRGGAGAIDGDEVLPVGEIGVEPGENGTREAKMVG